MGSKRKNDFEPYWQDEKDWPSTVEFLSSDDLEARLRCADIIGYLVGYAHLSNTRCLGLLGDPDASTYELLFSFSTTEEKDQFLDLVRSNQDLGDDYIENDFISPTTEEIRNARPLAASYPKIDLQLVFLQYAGKTPSLAGCAKCRMKFFTPQQLMRQPEAAAQYLREKFTQHKCKWQTFEQTRPWALPTRRLWIMKQTDDTSWLGICEACGMRFLAPVYLRADADQAENEIRLQFGQHRCRRRNAS